ncbi:MAG: ABC transporter permease subunit [Planctomycetota bacterium]|jgi:ABC-type transport system involved in multi-copper enzyme maturation permease subunit
MALTGTLGLDPMMRRELFGISRRSRTYASRILYVGIVCVILWGTWAGMGAAYGGLTVSYSEMAAMGRYLFSTFIAVQLAFVSLAAIFFSADLVTREVRAGTLGLLVLTPLTPWQIIFGKWKACMAQVLMVVLCGLPILAACAYLRAVGGMDVVRYTGLTVGYAAMAAGLGIWSSALARTGWGAIIRAVVLLVLMTFFPSLLAIGLPQTVCFLHPPVTFAAMMGGPYTHFAGLEVAWISASAVAIGMGLLFLKGAATRTAELALLTTHFSGTATPRGRETLTESLDLFRVGGWAARRGVPDGNPVLWKELRTDSLGSLRSVVRLTILIYVLCLPFLLLILLVESVGSALVGTAVAFVWIIFLLVAAGGGASLFVKEKEEKKWDILLSTPLTRGQIAYGKLAGGLLGLAPLAVCVGISFFVVGMVGTKSLGGGFMLAVVFSLFAAFTYLCGAYFSSRSPRMRSAFGRTIAILLGVVVLLPILATLPFPAGEEYLGMVISATNPFAFFGLTVDRSWDSHDRARYASSFFAFVVLYSSLSMMAVWGVYRRLGAEASRR